MGPSLEEARHDRPTASDAQVQKSIREGKKGTMMTSLEKPLSAAEIKGLVAHTRNLGQAT